MHFYLSSTISVLAAVAAAFSAAIAYKSNRDLAKTDRERRIREVSLLANKVDAAATDVDELGARLKLVYRELSISAGQGPGSSRLLLKTDEIEKKRGAVMPMQQTARDLLEGGPEKLTDEQIANRLLEFDGYLARIDRIRGRFHVDLGSAESQTSMYRQEAIKKP